ncbi:hypothetical protein BVI434_2490015 [Burkholderia vietnamiensis]|nr:hypothetical protein BVI434_2490015 [Burkholderia vietnamiensis]
MAKTTPIAMVCVIYRKEIADRKIRNRADF